VIFLLFASLTEREVVTGMGKKLQSESKIANPRFSLKRFNAVAMLSAGKKLNEKHES
jgi:hypothetical protein